MRTLLVVMSRSPALSVLVEQIRSVGHQVVEVDEAAAIDAPPEVALALLDAPPETANAGGLKSLLCAFGGLPVLLLGSVYIRSQDRLAGPLVAWLNEHSSLQDQCAVVCSRLQQDAPALQVGDLRLDPTHGTLLYRHRSVSLTPTEFRVLHTMMCQPGTLIDHGSLETLSDSQNVDAHLRSIRRKFSGHQMSLRLLGSRSLGYAIDARQFTRFPRNSGLALKYNLLHLL